MSSRGRLFLSGVISAGIHVCVLTSADHWVDPPRSDAPEGATLLVTLMAAGSVAPELHSKIRQDAGSVAPDVGASQYASVAGPVAPNDTPVDSANAHPWSHPDEARPDETGKPAAEEVQRATTEPKTEGIAASTVAEPIQASTRAPVEQAFRARPATGSVKPRQNERKSARKGRKANTSSQKPAAAKSGRGNASSMVGGGDVTKAAPNYRTNPQPKYPRIARRKGLAGTVILEVRVNASGLVGECRVHASSGHRVLDEQALRTVRKWTFEPGRKGDERVAMWVRVPIRFELK